MFFLFPFPIVYRVVPACAYLNHEGTVLHDTLMKTLFVSVLHGVNMSRCLDSVDACFFITDS